MLHRIKLGALLATHLVALGVLWPDWRAVGRGIAAPHAWVDRVGADSAAGTLVSAGLWCLAAWIVLALLAILAARLPGPTGRVARAVTRRTVPALLARCVLGVTGLSVAAGAIAPAVAGATPAPPVPISTGSPASVGWPTTPETPSGSAATSVPTPRPSTPQPSTPVHTTAPPTQPPTATLPTTTPPTTTPPTTTPPTTTPPTTTRTPQAPTRPPPPTPTTPAPTPPTGPVTVAPGDSLWVIAASRLSPDAGPTDIAAEWPRWYAANRAEIGPDPGQIRPGQVLRPPRPASSEASATTNTGEPG